MAVQRTEPDAGRNGHARGVAKYEKELAGYLQERIKPGLNRGAIPLLARSIAKEIAHREPPPGLSEEGEAEDEPTGEADDKPTGELEDETSGEAQADTSGEAEDETSGEAQDDTSGEAEDEASGEAEDEP